MRIQAKIFVLFLCISTTTAIGWRKELEQRPQETLKARPITQTDVDNYSIDELALLFNVKEEIDVIIVDMANSVNTLWIIIASINIIAM